MPIPADTCYQTLTINGTQYRAEDITVRWTSRQPTSITITGIETAAGHVLEAAPPRYALVEFDFFGVAMTGFLTGFRNVGSGAAITNVATVRTNGLYALERLYYFQHWMARQDDDPATLERSGYVVMFQNACGRNMTVREQIDDIMLAALMRWPSLPAWAVSGAFADAAMPEFEDRNVKTLAALVKAVKYFPAVVVRDSDGESPIVITEDFEAWSHPPERFNDYDFGEDDSGIDSVTVEFVQNNFVGGARWIGVHAETASKPGAHPFAAVEGTLMYDGATSNMTRGRIEVETEDLPEDLNNKNWWWEKAQTFFRNSRLADVTIKDAERSGFADAGQYPRIVTNTAMPDEINASGVNIKARTEVFSCKASYKIFNAKGELVKEEVDAPISVELITTNAQTREYKWTESMDGEAGDELPVGIAQRLLSSLLDSRRGVVEFDLRDAAEPTIPLIGETYNGLPCQAVEVSSSTLICHAEFAPCEKLSVDETADLMRAFRTRAQSRYTRKARETGEVNNGAEIRANKAAPIAAVQAGAGELKKEVLTGADDDYKKIDLDPDDIGGENKTAKMREHEYTAADGSTKKAYFLSTAPDGEDENGGGSGGDGGGDKPPPCGHPGNKPGGGSDNSGDHPGDNHNGSDHPGDNTSDHPGDNPSPPCTPM